ncbi:unnamed protein product [Rotaria sp. Silwood2]|nr:unnamed protein product [Rotaria sp. Silwood2]
MKRFGSETAFQVARDSNKFQDTRRGWAQSQNLENLLYPSARKYAHLSYFRQIESDTCGIKPSESAIEERIYGGSAAMPNSWPWPVCLPDSDVKTNSLLVVLGWGDEKAGSNALYLLKQSTATVMDACKNVDDYDKTKVFCIVDLTHKSSVCKGDSGGPALQKHGGRWVIEGVLSHGDDCKAEPGEYQNVFVRVFAYLPWINNIIDG